MKKIIFSLIFFSALTIHLNGAIPPGYYYLARGKQHTELKTALKDIVSSGTFLSYGSGADFTWQGFYFTDRNAADSTVIDMYSNIVRKQPDFNSVYGMHIEHSFPKSWWGGYVNNAYKDLNHLYPSDGLTNSTKNDFPLGEVEIPASLLDNGVSKVGKNTFGTTYSGNCFEPADEYKGDFARSYLYVSTVYDKHSETWQTPMTETSSYLIWKPWAIEMLLKWHHEDPVSEKELTRVEEVYKIQGNRNPFIDYPDLVDYIWGDKTTETYSFPTETEPFLVTPNRWTKIDFGVVMQNDTQRSIIDLEGVNLTSNLSYSLKNTTSGLTISYGTPTTTGDVYSRAIFIDFDASTVGETIDTLLISGGGLNANILIPIKARVTSNFMALDATSITAVSATLNWMKLPDATSYQLDVYQGAEHAGDLFFSSYVEGSTGFNKAVAIYNGTGATVDLSKYSLKKQNNGFGSFGLETPLVGTLANGAVYVVAHLGAGTDIANQANLKLGTSTTDQTTVVSFNGNDAVALYHSGLQIDVIGEIDNPSDWGKDVTLQRKTTITGPITQFSWDEWTNRGADIYTNLNS
ncbi:MAG TPA: endonuclease, partial [Paludibacteraceae bacterium]|nr:endonuclease [Paludibacteraceae bacterium]